MQEEWRLQACRRSEQVPFFPLGPSCSLRIPRPESAHTHWKSEVLSGSGAVTVGKQTGCESSADFAVSGGSLSGPGACFTPAAAHEVTFGRRAEASRRKAAVNI